MGERASNSMNRKTPGWVYGIIIGGAVISFGATQPGTGTASPTTENVAAKSEQVRLYNGSPACYRQAWSTDVLQGIGAPDTETNREVMIAWSRAEGGHFANRAKNNLLNTNRPMPGSEVAIKTDAIRGYTSPEAGVKATVDSIKLPWYSSIVDAFKRGDDADGAIKAIRYPAKVWAASHYNGVSWTNLRSLARQDMAETCGGEA